MVQNVFTRDFAEAARNQAEMARGRQHNVELFEALFLTLGSDCLRLDGTRHDAELAEGKASAAARWSRLLDLESQVQHDEQALAARPKKRPAAPGDDLLPDRTLAERDRAFLEETRARRNGFEVLKAQAERERAELEGYAAKK